MFLFEANKSQVLTEILKYFIVIQFLSDFVKPKQMEIDLL